jgi:hypothetical protein
MNSSLLFNYQYGRSAMAIFIFLLIISGNYLGNLFPCKVQDQFENNIYLKHFLGFFTLLFFVILTLPEKYDSEGNKIPEFRYLNDIVKICLFLYAFFLVLSKTPYYIWLTVFLLTSIVYLLELKKTDFVKDNVDDKENSKKSTSLFGFNSLSEINNTQNKLTLIGLFLTLAGFLIYMGEKKFENKKNFSYMKFIFGSIKCKGKTKNNSVLNSIKHIFD